MRILKGTKRANIFVDLPFRLDEAALKEFRSVCAEFGFSINNFTSDFSGMPAEHSVAFAERIVEFALGNTGRLLCP